MLFYRDIFEKSHVNSNIFIKVWYTQGYKCKESYFRGYRKLLWVLSKLSKFNALTSSESDTKRTLQMHLFLFTNSAQRELVSICIAEYTRPLNKYF